MSPQKRSLKLRWCCRCANSEDTCTSNVRWVCCWRAVISIRRRAKWAQTVGRHFLTCERANLWSDPFSERQMERGRRAALDEEALKPRRRGWYLGREQFKEQMLELMEGKLGESHSGELHRETAEQRANRIIAQEFARRGWQESWLRPPQLWTLDFGL
ncbi:MAG: hypothetical protein NT154_26305 [Verrucomicrobia bacterium]|nr:hypothetical protein [Verrucomicrobiota bacterium]